MLKAAFRRFLVLLAMVAGVTAALSLLIGLASGSSATRAVSLGFYLIGSFLLISGFFVGNRGPARLKRSSDAMPLFGSRMLRWATPAEQEETINMSAVFVAIGLTLIVLGVAADPRYKLF
ncbi:MAG: hypothetical protein E6G45_01870 [Actinobacteria bacterium]|nr:MAG: hypothetical protein E6G45_01870 [Actinomycetota bacterium]